MAHIFFNHPFFLASEEFQDMFSRLSKPAEQSYPPYNIEILDDVTMQITIAVAGFKMSDLQIYQEDNKLIVKGKIDSVESKSVVIHRGIATRQFVRQFCLLDGLEPIGAFIDNGLLYIKIKRHIQQKVVKQIAIHESNQALQMDESKHIKDGLGNNKVIKMIGRSKPSSKVDYTED